MKPMEAWISVGAAVLAVPLAGLLTVSVTAGAAPARSGSAGAGPAGTPAYYRYAGTKTMAERLEKMIQAADPINNTFLNDRRAEIFRKAVQDAQAPKEHVDMQAQLALELLNSGKTEAAIQEIVNLMTYVSQNFKAFSPKQRTFLLNALAVCRLRQGEEQNCLDNHSAESCLLPIRGKGVHTRQDGSRRAIKVLTQQLGEFPDDLEARWLLNLGYMTVGEYPDRVPPQWLIPPKVFESDYDIKRFTDRAGDLGLDVDDLAGGSITEDFDGDGDLDIMASSMALRGQLRYFRNNSDGTFTEGTKEAGLLGEVGGLNILHSDYNNDGHPDVLVLRGGWMQEDGRYPNSLLRNNGDGTFADVTEEAGMLSFHPTQTASWLDFDNDGWIDLYIGNESGGGHDHPCELYRNNGDGTFTDCAAAAGVANVGYVKAVGSGDFNNDGRPDIYLSRRGDANVLYRNDGPRPGGQSRCDWVFTDVAAAAGVTEPKHSFPAWFFDYDNDGWLDIFVAGYSIKSVADVAADYLGLPGEGEKARLYHSNRDGTFRDVSRDAHLFKVLHAMGSNFGDLDNDGWLDFYLGTGDPKLGTLIPNRMFRNAEGKHFQDVTSSGGFGHLQKGHGVSFADLDNDGDQDIYEVMGGAYTGDRYRNTLYENPGHGNHWITLKLEGVKSNRAAVGARIKVTVDTPAGERAIHRTVSTGGSFGDSPLRQQIGLGQARAIRSIEIVWPTTGATQRLAPPPMDAVYRIREGDPAPVPIKLKPFKFASRPRPVHDHTAPAVRAARAATPSPGAGAAAPATPIPHAATAPPRPQHTFSIVARDPATGEIGAAVQSHWFSVGPMVPWAEAGVGAVATQSFVRVDYGPEGLALMKQGVAAPEALRRLVASDEARDVRQVAMIDALGRVAAHTGSKCIRAAGHRVGTNYSVQANLMVDAGVWPAMARAFESARGDLAERMLEALEAAQAAGGDIRGRQSAAIVIVKGKTSGKPWNDRVMELRVEDHPQPLQELRRLVTLWRAYEEMNAGDLAVEKNDVDGAVKHYGAAEAMLPDMDEFVFWHAAALAQKGRLEESLPLFARAFRLQPGWYLLVPRLPASGLLPDDKKIIERILSVGPAAD